MAFPPGIDGRLCRRARNYLPGVASQRTNALYPQHHDSTSRIVQLGHRSGDFCPRNRGRGNDYQNAAPRIPRRWCSVRRGDRDSRAGSRIRRFQPCLRFLVRLCHHASARSIALAVLIVAGVVIITVVIMTVVMITVRESRHAITGAGRNLSHRPTDLGPHPPIEGAPAMQPPELGRPPSAKPVPIS